MTSGNPSRPFVYLSGMRLRLLLATLAAGLQAACSSAPPYQGLTADQLFTHAQEAGRKYINIASRVLAGTGK